MVAQAFSGDRNPCRNPIRARGVFDIADALIIRARIEARRAGLIGKADDSPWERT
jgi:hypothetical protein